MTHQERHAQEARAANTVRQLATAIRQAEAALPVLEALVHSEQGDVDRLEGWTFSRLWAMARGIHDDELGRERAEAYRAEAELQQTRVRLGELRHDLEHARRQQSEMAGAGNQWAAALQAKEELLRARGTQTGQQLGDLAVRRGEIRQQQKEINDALAAVALLLPATQRAADLLHPNRWPSARAASLMDIWVPNIAQRQLDEATAAVAFAGRHVLRLNWELAQVKGIDTTVSPLSEDTFRRYTDVWFNEVTSDAVVIERIAQARLEVLRVSQAATLVQSQLLHLWREAQAQARLQHADRARLLNLR